MPAVMDPETIPVDDLPTVWSPVQAPLSEDERADEVEAQATASLLWSADTPESILRLLLSETAIARVFDPPERYDPAHQGEWDPDLVTFAFARPIRLMSEERAGDRLTLEYKLEGAGCWRMEFTPESLTLTKV
jgi:hypothetical protein